MMKKLQIKLVIVSMLSIFIVLFVIIGFISMLNYRDIVKRADDILSVLAENDGAFSNIEDDYSVKNFSDKFELGSTQTSQEQMYESRYFSVFLDSNGDVISADTGQIASVDNSVAIEYAQSVIETGKKYGFIDSYRYIVDSDDTETHIIFLYCGGELSIFYTLLVTELCVSAVGLLAVLLLIIFFSGRIVKPFIKNHEKQKRFITDAGHELKTPLTIINADAEVLEMDIGENEWLTDIRTQTKRLADLTNNLIVLSRMEEEQTKINMIEFPLSDVAEDTVETFRALAKTKGKTLNENIQPMVSIKGDENSIRRLITILLDNAMKYSEEGGRITLTLEKKRNTVRLSVFNTTESIQKEQLSHLFDRFYRADKARNSKTGGYGLGLSIAASIVTAHKGKISAATQDGKSIIITVNFPV